MAGKTPEGSRFSALRQVLWILVGAGIVAFGIVFTLRGGEGPARTQLERLELKPVSGIGGSFSLIDQHGNPFTEASLLGKPTLLFFGYTFCPDVCPTTLLEVGVWMKELGPDAERLRVVFVTVDPERDTQKALESYLSSFDPSYIGLTGQRAEVDKAVKAYKVYARKIDSKDGAYTMDHTAAVYLLDSQARFVGLIKFQEEQAKAVALLKMLLSH